MSDLGAATWSETAASNNASPPDGWPESMNPSDVNNSAREDKAAEKRFWNRINAVKTTGGTTSAYTLTYDVAAASYYDGEIHSFVVNATNAAAATLNINGLGARQLRLFGGNLLAGALLANDIVQARYNSSAGAFDIIPQGVWTRLGTQNPSASATVDFTSIPAGVNHLLCVFDWRPGTDNVSMVCRTYDAAGNVDSGATDYAYAADGVSSSSTSGDSGSGGSTGLVLNRAGNAIDSHASIGIGGDIAFSNIQAAVYTKANWRVTYLDNAGTELIRATGGGWRADADRITGLRFLFSAGTGTGKFTLFASA